MRRLRRKARRALLAGAFVACAVCLSPGIGAAQDAGVPEVEPPSADAGAADPEASPDAGTDTTPQTEDAPDGDSVAAPVPAPPADPSADSPAGPDGSSPAVPDRSSAADPDASTDPDPAPTPEDRWADTHVDTSEGASSAPEDAGGIETARGIEPEDVVLFVPRLVLFVPKLLFSALFWPIHGLLEVVERHAIIPHIEEVLYWNDDHTLGWSPALSFRSGVGLTFGANVFHDDLFGHGESLSVAARYGGRFTQGYELLFSGDRVGGTRLWLEARARYEVNPGQIFEGIGVVQGPGGVIVLPQDPRATAIESYYGQERILGLLTLGHTHGTTGSLLKTGFSAIFNRREFGDNDTGDTQTSEIYDLSRVPGFEEGATTMELQANLVVDNRTNAGLNGTGVHLELFGGYVPPAESWTYWHYGGELRWTIDLYNGTRLLSLRTALEAVHGPRDEIPFTELPRLGGADRLRGYQEDQFRDLRTALATLEYRYPIHQNVQGEVFVDAGYVAGSYGDLFGDLGDWKVGGGGGLLIGSDSGVDFRIELAYGDGLQFFFATDVARAFDGRSSEL